MAELVKRSPMPRRRTPLKRTLVSRAAAPAKPRKPLPAQSAKQPARRAEIVAAQDAAMARDRHTCQGAPWLLVPLMSDTEYAQSAALAAARAVLCSQTIDPHHKATQRSHPEWAAKQWNIITLCRAHHDWVHAHIGLARLLGWYGAPDADDIPPEGTP